MRTHNHGSFKSLEITKLLYDMKTLEITATRSQKNILKLLKHKQRLSKWKTQISSWSQHEIEDLWNAGLRCCSPAFLLHVNHLSTVCAGSRSATVRPSDEVFECWWSKINSHTALYPVLCGEASVVLVPKLVLICPFMESHSSGTASTWCPAFASTGSVYDIVQLIWIWKTYHYSPKSTRKLESIGTELGINVLKPTQVSRTGWLQEISRALQVLITPSKDGSGQFSAILCNMEHLSCTSKNAVARTLRSL